MDVQLIPLDLIDPPLVVSRLQLEGPEFEELVADIREHGITLPLIVAPYLPVVEGTVNTLVTTDGRPDGPVVSRFRVVDGYRRYRAAQRLALVDVPCTLQEAGEAAELETLMRVALHRKDLTPVEEGVMFRSMHEGLHLTAAGIAQRVGKSRAYVEARLDLVDADAAIIIGVQAGEISFSVALELLRCEHPEDRRRLLYHACHGGCTAETMRLWVRDAQANRAALPPHADPRQAVVSAEVYPVVLARCGWCEEQVPGATLGSLLLCVACRQFLFTTRDRLAAADATHQRGETHVDRGESDPDSAPGVRAPGG